MQTRKTVPVAAVWRPGQKDQGEPIIMQFYVKEWNPGNPKVRRKLVRVK